MTREEFKVGDKIHSMERELYNLKIKIITSKKIPEPLREELANDVFEIEKQVKNNGVLDDVIVSGKDCKIPMRELGSDKCLICGKKVNEH